MDFDAIYNERKDMYNSHDLIIDNKGCGQGGTTQWNRITSDNNYNNITLVNNHWLQYEAMVSLERGPLKKKDNRLFSIGNYFLINDLYGKTHILDEVIQQETGHPKCFCYLYNENPYLFNLLCRGFLPPEWCEAKCPYAEQLCDHKIHIKNCFSNANRSMHNKGHCQWILPKAYNNNPIGNIVLSIQKKFPKSDVFYDENFFEYIDKDLSFGATGLLMYKDFIYEAIKKNRKLYEVAKDLFLVIDKLINNIKIGTKVSQHEKFKDVFESIKQFVQSYDGKKKRISCSNALIDWNKSLTETVYKNKIKPHIYLNNQFYNIIDFFSEVFKDNNMEKSQNCSMFDTENLSFLYCIDNSDVIRENIKKGNKFILRSGYGRFEEIFNGVFPDLDDYGILKDPNFVHQYKQSYYLTTGKYTKPVLVDNAGRYQPSYYTLAKLTKNIMDKIVKGDSALLLSYKRFIGNLRRTHFSKPEYSNLVYEWWFNLQGKDVFKDCKYVISFGFPGKPRKYNKMKAKRHNLPLELVEDYSEVGEVNQGAGRPRTNINPDEKIFISLSKKIPSTIKNGIPFKRIEDLLLFEYLKSKGKTTAIDIWKEVYLEKITERSVRRQLQTYERDNVIKCIQKNNRSPKYYSM